MNIGAIVRKKFCVLICQRGVAAIRLGPASVSSSGSAILRSIIPVAVEPVHAPNITIAFSSQFCLSQSLGSTIRMIVVRIRPANEIVRIAAALFMITSSFIVAIAVMIRYSSASVPTCARDSLSMNSLAGVLLIITPNTSDTSMAGT